MKSFSTINNELTLVEGSVTYPPSDPVEVTNFEMPWCNSSTSTPIPELPPLE